MHDTRLVLRRKWDISSKSHLPDLPYSFDSTTSYPFLLLLSRLHQLFHFGRGLCCFVSTPLLPVSEPRSLLSGSSDSGFMPRRSRTFTEGSLTAFVTDLAYLSQDLIPAPASPSSPSTPFSVAVFGNPHSGREASQHFKDVPMPRYWRGLGRIPASSLSLCKPHRRTWVGHACHGGDMTNIHGTVSFGF